MDDDNELFRMLGRLEGSSAAQAKMLETLETKIDSLRSERTAQMDKIDKRVRTLEYLIGQMTVKIGIVTVVGLTVADQAIRYFWDHFILHTR